MDILLLVAGIACLFAGLAGAILPLPGPALSFFGLVLLHISKFAEFSQTTLYSLGFITIVIGVLDYYIPVWGTKKFGGTRNGAIPAIGIFIGTFTGALLGELIGGAKINAALKSALGSFVGFLTGIVIQLLLCLVMIGFAVSELWKNIG
jgi:uncharacterized protein YqgC (DUF456 family)